MKRTEIIRLANVIGMDIDKEQDQLALVDALKNVSVPSDFIEWIRGKRDTVTYANRREKLTILHTRYKKEVDLVPILVIEQATRVTVDKFKDAISNLRDNEIELEGHLERLKVQDTQWFTNAEISRLMAIGTLRKCISAYEAGNLYEELYNISVKRYLIGKSESLLSDGQKRVKRIVDGLC